MDFLVLWGNFMFCFGGLLQDEKINGKGLKQVL